jgi:lipoprotein-anchoring transpeptidase ErfK/SrfK
MRKNALSVLLVLISGVSAWAFGPSDDAHVVVISVPDQQMVVFQNGVEAARYPVSTSRYGVGDSSGSYATPLGSLEIAEKIGQNMPPGTVFKGRRPTGEILTPNAPGRDPIVTRILWLRGLETGNRNAYDRAIYIHGTPVERLIGRPASYGCVRMRSRDIVQLFNMVGVGAKINICTLPVRMAKTVYELDRRHMGYLASL